MITSDQLKDVLERADALKRYLNIDQKKVEFEEEQLRTQAPDFWEDPKRAEEQMKKVKTLERWIKGYAHVRQLADELQLAFDFHKDELVTEEEVDDDYSKAISAIEDLELKNMLRQKEDPMDCVMKINSGAGGTESQDWAQMLMRMYMRWAEAHGHKVTISNLQERHDGDRGRRVRLRLPQERERSAPSCACVAVQRAGQAHDVVRFGVRVAAHRRYHRGVCRPVED